MKLRQIFVGSSSNSTQDLNFNTEVHYLGELYWRLLRASNWDCPFVRINIILSNHEDRIEELPLTYDRKVKFDFLNYYQQKTVDKRKIIIKKIHEALMEIAETKGYQQKPLKTVYIQCHDFNFKNEWFLFEKAKRSPDHQHFANVYCNWTAESLAVSLKIYDVKKQLINTKPWFEIHTNLGEMIYRCKPRWIDNEIFTLFSTYDDEIWRMNISDKLNQEIRRSHQ